MTAEEACKIILQKKNMPYISGIVDIGYGYVIGCTAFKHAVLCGNPTLIRKDTGEMSVYTVPDHLEELSNGKKIRVPDEYWFGGTID